MGKTDCVLDFTVRLGREMLECGANLERVNLTIMKICKSYGLSETAIYSLSTYISVSAREIGKESKSRFISVPFNGIHLEKLHRLCSLADQICEEKPQPETLEDRLFETLMVPNYSVLTTIAGYMLAMSCLCLLFGGKIGDVAVVNVSTILLYYAVMYLSRKNLNRIIMNPVCMFLAGTIALGAYHTGIATDFHAIIITNAFYLIPGIPMVNAMRNLLCGNEMNGIIEMFKVVLEVSTIVLGLFLACCLFGKGIPFV